MDSDILRLLGALLLPAVGYAIKSIQVKRTNGNKFIWEQYKAQKKEINRLNREVAASKVKLKLQCNNCPLKQKE